MGNVRWMEHLSVSRVYIIIVNWNGWKDTIECLESLLCLEYNDFRIVVCDNGSHDDSIVKLREWGERKFRSAWQELSRIDAENGVGLPNAKLTLVEIMQILVLLEERTSDCDMLWHAETQTIVGC